MDDFKIELINYLTVLIDSKINLVEYAKKNHIPIYVNGNLDKGWKGNTIEHLLNIKKNNKKGSDYPSLEIKTVPIIWNSNGIKIKETTCLSVLNTEEIVNYSFENSSLYNKIKNIIFILIDVSDLNNPFISQLYDFDLNVQTNLKKMMENDYNNLAEHILDNIDCDLPLDNNLSGKLGKVIQPRPKTGKKGNYTWAFYLKAHVLTELMQPVVKKSLKI